VQSNGSEHLVVWEDDRTGDWDIWGAWVYGLLSPSEPFEVVVRAAEQSNPSLAWNESNFLVVWHDLRNAATGVDIYGANVDIEGVVSTSFPISQAPGLQAYPSVAAGGSTALVAWEDARGTDADIFGSFVDPDGSVQHPNGLEISKAAGDQDRPAVAFNGDFFVVWRDERNGANVHIWGASVKPNATVNAAFPVAPATTNHDNPDVTIGFGEGFGATYNRPPNGFSGTPNRVMLRTVFPSVK
jgi:hypothetical protein